MYSIFENNIPFFSVIICTYNREQYLNKAINSLIMQKFKDWECIIIDDGSTDNTFELINFYLKSSDKFKYFFQENSGIATARNSGLRLASGRYITFLDSDDEYAEDHLHTRKDIIDQEIELDLLHGGVKIIGNEFVPDMYNPERLINLNDCVIGGTFFINKAKAIEIDGFPLIKYGDDKLFFDKALQHNWKIIKTELKTYIYYRDTPDSLCNNIGKNDEK